MKKIPIVLAVLISISLIANAQSTSSVSNEDIKYIEFFKKHGLLPKGMNTDNIPTDQLKELIELLKIESGVDDIDFVERHDERFSSPEKTWELYRSSFLTGDIELSNRCLMPKFREKLEAIRTAIGDEKMKRKIEEMRPIERVTDDNGSAKYRIKRKIGDKEITFYVYFVEVFGKWKILRY